MCRCREPSGTYPTIQLHRTTSGSGNPYRQGGRSAGPVTAVGPDDPVAPDPPFQAPPPLAAPIRDPDPVALNRPPGPVAVLVDEFGPAVRPALADLARGMVVAPHVLGPREVRVAALGRA